MRLQARGVIRRLLRRFRTVKGAVFAIVGLLVIGVWLSSVMVSLLLGMHSNPHTVRLVAPLAMLLICSLTLLGGAGDRAISYTPGEINFLFPGPFTRRELLVYKLARTLLGVSLTGLIFSVVLLRHSTSWPAALVGSMLGLSLIQLLALAALLAAQVVGARAYSLGRRVVVGMILAVAALALAPAIGEIRRSGAAGLPEAAVALNRSPVARVALSPFKPFARAFTAESMPALLGWAAVCLAIDVAVLAVVLRLDADYREAALAASQRVSERLQRMRRGIVAPKMGATGRKPRTRVPLLPWLGGAGPTAWRQLTALLRTSRWTLFVLLIFAVGCAPMLLLGKQSLVPMLVIVGWVTMFLTIVLRFDFRAELDQMAWLKALPLSPTATAAGQLAAPVTLITLVQAILLGIATALAPADHRPKIMAALPFLLPFNLIMLAVENLLFLLFPTRVVGTGPGDVGQMGRMIVFFFFKLIVVAFACGVAAAAGFAAFYASGKSKPVGVAAAAIALACVSLAIVPCVGWAYARFDPSSDTPD